MRTAIVTALFVLVGVAEVPRVSAQDRDYVVHKVRKDDNLKLLAAEYYGDRRHALFIMAVNKIEHTSKLKPGQRIRIPRAREVITTSGDGFESLAAAHMGDKRRAPFLAAFNGMKPGDSIPAGLKLRIPFHIRHKAKNTVTIASLAATYLGGSNKAALLRRYNFVDDDKDALEPGETLTIPVYQVRLRASKRKGPDKESRTRIAKRKAMQELASRVLESAARWWRKGDYGALKRELTKIDVDYLDTDVAVDVALLLGGTYVAYGDNDSALALFKKVIERKPTHALGRYAHSPKVRKVWKRAGGTVKAAKK